MELLEKKSSSKVLESFLVEWNIMFRFDRQWRKKYNTPFLSQQHLEANPVEIWLDILEDKLFEKARTQYEQKEKDKLDYEKTGKFLKENVSTEEDEDKLFELARKTYRN